MSYLALVAFLEAYSLTKGSPDAFFTSHRRIISHPHEH